MSENLPAKVADEGDPVEAPRDEEKALSAAYLRLIGHTQEAAAKAVGIGERTLRRYEECSWWPELRRQAADRWLTNLAAQARNTLMEAIKDGDADKALKVLERTEPALAPKQKHEISGEDGAPIEFTLHLGEDHRDGD